MSAAEKVREYLHGRLSSVHPALSFIERYVHWQGGEHVLTTHMLDDLVAENDDLRESLAYWVDLWETTTNNVLELLDERDEWRERALAAENTIDELRSDLSRARKARRW